jgi:raffinose/stachyose/melibiose transport system substrate-binding protein
MYMYLTNRYGGYAFSKAQSRQIRFDDDAFVNAGLIYQKWAGKGYFGTKPLSESYDDAKSLMFTGSTAMHVTGSWMCSGYADPKSTDQTIGFYPFPIVEGGVGKASDVMGQTDIGWAASKFGKDRKDAIVTFMHYAMSPDVVSKDKGRVTSVPGIPAPNRLTEMASAVLTSAQKITFWWDQDLPPDITGPLQDTLQAFFIPGADVKEWLTKYEALAAESLGPVKK